MSKVKDVYAEVLELHNKLTELRDSVCETVELGDALTGLGFEYERASIQRKLEVLMDLVSYDILPHKYDEIDVDLINKGL